MAKKNPEMTAPFLDRGEIPMSLSLNLVSDMSCTTQPCHELAYPDISPMFWDGSTTVIPERESPGRSDS